MREWGVESAEGRGDVTHGKGRALQQAWSGPGLGRNRRNRFRSRAARTGPEPLADTKPCTAVVMDSSRHLSGARTARIQDSPGIDRNRQESWLLRILVWRGPQATREKWPPPLVPPDMGCGQTCGDYD